MGANECLPWGDGYFAAPRALLIRAQLQGVKDHVKELQADLGLIEAQEEVKTCKELLAEALAQLEGLCRDRAHSSRRVNTQTGEVLS